MDINSMLKIFIIIYFIDCLIVCVISLVSGVWKCNYFDVHPPISKPTISDAPPAVANAASIPAKKES